MRGGVGMWHVSTRVHFRTGGVVSFDIALQYKNTCTYESHCKGKSKRERNYPA